MATAVFLGASVGFGIHWLSSRWPQQAKGRAAGWHMGLLVGGTAALFAILWQRLGFSGSFTFLAGLITFFMLITAVDLKHNLIPNSLILPATGAMLIYQFIPTTAGSWWALAGALAAFGLFGLVRAIAPGGLGGGDIKLVTFLGATFGLPYLFWALVAGVLLGGVTAVFLLISQRGDRKTMMPYGPFLCFGGITALLINPLPWLLAFFQ